MKALMLNQYYSSKTQILIYAALTVVITIFFTTFNDSPISAAMFACVYPALGAMDYLKKESASDWLKYAITMPIKRRTIVNTHFLVHFVLVLIGFIISLIIISILKASFVTGLNATFIGVGFAFQFSLIYLLTYKFGSENSNGIYIIGMLLIMVVFIVCIIIKAFLQNNSIALLSSLALNSYYLVFSIIIGLVIYYLSLKHFDNADF
jgi:ABC-2 type transport system permease protein